MAFVTFLTFVVSIATCYSFQMISRIGLEQAHSNIKHKSYRNNVKTLPTAPEMSINVLDYGAVGDGKTDNTAAFKSAFDAATKNGGGYVIAPTGRYVFQGMITIPPGVSLIGSYLTVPSHQTPKSAPTDGTVLIPYHGKGSTSVSNSFITINEDATLKGVVIYYNEQPCTNSIPVEFPPSVYMNGQNAAIEDVELLNSYIGIWAVEAHRHYIARIQGQPIYIGVYIDETYDIGRIEDVHFNPWFCKEINYMYTQTQFGRSFVFGRSDWEYVFNTFSFAYAIGYHFIQTSTGSMNGNFLGLGADYSCNASIQVDASQPAGLLITNGEFTAFHNSQFAPNNTAIPVQLMVGASNTGPVVMNSCSFWGPSNNIAQLYGSGTTSFIASQFVEWDGYNKNGAEAIFANNGNVIIEACEFQKSGVQVQFLKGTKKVIVTNNILNGAWNGQIDSSVAQAISNNL